MDKPLITPYIKCRNPTYFYKDGIKHYQPCGTCDICRALKSNKYAQQLMREEGVSKWSFFITLTYAPEWLPTYEIVDLHDTHIVYDKLHRPHHLKWNWERESFRYDNPLQHVMLVPAFTRLYPKRGTDEYELLDAQDDYPCIEIKDDYFAQNIEYYYKHRELYEKAYCKTNFHNYRGFIDLCPKRDLETFLLRFKNFAVRKCNNATFRYFAVADYGTNGCAPHWHLLLFTDSDELAKAMLDVEERGTLRKPSPCAKIIRSLWRYGIGNTSKVRTSCASYVASYLNTPANFPRVFKGAIKPKCYHSVKLGTVVAQDEAFKHIKDRDWQYFQNLSYHDYEGYVLPYQWTKKDYASYLPTLPYFGRANLLSARSIVEKVLKFIRQCYKAYPDCTYRDISIALYDNDSLHCDVSFFDYKCLQDHCGNYAHRDLNLYYSIVLSVMRIYRSMLHLGVDFDEYCSICKDFEAWYDMRSLNIAFGELEKYPTIALEYYSNLEDDFANQKGSYYLAYTDKISSWIHSNIKHKDVAEKYRFVDN